MFVIETSKKSATKRGKIYIRADLENSLPRYSNVNTKRESKSRVLCSSASEVLSAVSIHNACISLNQAVCAVHILSLVLLKLFMRR